MKKIIVTIVAGAMLFAASCSGSKDESVDPPGGSTCDGVAASFANNVSPIIQTNCATGASCHGEGSVNGPGALTSFTAIKNAAGSIKSAVVSGLMPKNGSLNTAQISSIRCWVDNGAQNN